jgi:hypothetical protein
LLSTIMRLQAHLAKSRRFLAGEGYCSTTELLPQLYQIKLVEHNNAPKAHLAKSRRFLAGEGYCSAIELHPRRSL